MITPLILKVIVMRINITSIRKVKTAAMSVDD